MARRKSSKRRTRRTTALSISGLAESFVLGSAVTKGLFNTNLVEFVTGTVDGKYNPGADGGQNITIPELIGLRVGSMSLILAVVTVKHTLQVLATQLWEISRITVLKH
jgi:hypothetical protein